MLLKKIMTDAAIAAILITSGENVKKGNRMILVTDLPFFSHPRRRVESWHIVLKPPFWKRLRQGAFG